MNLLTITPISQTYGYPMKTIIWTLILAITTLTVSQDIYGDPTPLSQESTDMDMNVDFTLVDSNGTSHTLSSYKGQYVVLEWVNFDCPFVKKQYRSGNMPRLQEAYTQKGVVWLAICSSAPEKQGYYDGKSLTNRIVEEKFKGSAYLLDPDGTVGMQYHAKTTPHLFILNPQLELIYKGAIDSVRSTDPDDIAKSTNYVTEALEAAMAGLPVPNPRTTSYGCSVKY